MSEHSPEVLAAVDGFDGIVAHGATRALNECLGVIKTQTNMTTAGSIAALALSIMAAADATAQAARTREINRDLTLPVLPKIIDALRLSITLFEEAQNRLEMDG